MIRRTYSPQNRISSKQRIVADDEYDENIVDSIDDLADNVEDMQDAVEDFTEDQPSIETDNNIENHYIAECESCQGIFISAVMQSDQQIDHISGICPLCQKDTDQYLKWVIKRVNRKNPLEVEDDPAGEYSMSPHTNSKDVNQKPGGAQL